MLRLVIALLLAIFFALLVIRIVIVLTHPEMRHKEIILMYQDDSDFRPRDLPSKKVNKENPVA